MKIRNGFVSNSSSSSFIVRKKHLTPKEIEIIRTHTCVKNDWQLHETDELLVGFTYMDNYPLQQILESLIYGTEEEHEKAFQNWFSISWHHRPGWAWKEMFWNEETRII